MKILPIPTKLEILGGLVSVGVVIALDRMGLTDAPADVEETEMPY